MTWTSTFKGAATVDTAGRLRCFDLYDDLEGEERGRQQETTTQTQQLPLAAIKKDSSLDAKDPSSKRGPGKRVQEIVTASGVTCLHDPETKVQSYSPKQGWKEATSISTPESLCTYCYTYTSWPSSRNPRLFLLSGCLTD